METNTTPVTTSSVGLRYGLLTGLVSTLFSFALNIMHQESSPARYLSFAILVGGLVLAMNHFKQQNRGFMSYGQGLGIGAVLSAVVGAISGIFAYIYMNFVDPDMLGRITEKMRADMEARGGLSDEQIDQAVTMSSKFMNGPVMVGAALLGTLLIGVLLSLVISAIIKNAQPEFE
ncbi:DUF4199 domain-containing protein [Hymenobacter properus]|uniref:DUF4199 domain-containing protein n=1 Tax=Hymenobacter properus TaxID=2791026 RepID=A0A931BHR7_9BACT|nr:DUF4199 domain-containing protein [Hymenobacter properus]MBF9144189.1 DUF4199 domain-containing protein [Hymenobacter properus]MBR7723007.1 DUF4199 domain-containing protein [Microvirga sp. SRT04]